MMKSKHDILTFAMPIGEATSDAAGAMVEALIRVLMESSRR